MSMAANSCSGEQHLAPFMRPLRKGRLQDVVRKGLVGGKSKLGLIWTVPSTGALLLGLAAGIPDRWWYFGTLAVIVAGNIVLSVALRLRR
jgi:hypothetical protein